MKPLKHIESLSIWALTAVFLVGPAPFEARSKVKRLDPKGVSTLTTHIESTDVQDIAETMVDSLLTVPIFSDRPVVMMGNLFNETGDPLDTKSITDKIRTALVRSGKVRFVANDLRNQIHSENSYQGSRRVNSETATLAGNATGARYMISGELSKIDTRVGKLRDAYYKLTLNLVDLKTQIIEWTDEKEIRKQGKN